MIGDRLLDGVEVLEAHPFEGGQLVGPAGQAVAQAVGQAGGAEPAVAAAGRPAEVAPVEQGDGPGRVLLGGQDGIDQKSAWETPIEA